MRDIKFRAWDEKQKVMYGPDVLDLFIHFDGKINHSDLGVVQGTNNTVQFSLMQYTGLKDRNGAEIYEGDIVKREWVEINPGSDDFIGVVKYVEGSFCLEDIEDPFSGDSLFIEIGTNEVIGNKHENPELLLEVTNS